MGRRWRWKARVIRLLDHPWLDGRVDGVVVHPWLWSRVWMLKGWR